MAAVYTKADRVLSSEGLIQQATWILLSSEGLIQTWILLSSEGLIQRATWILMSYGPFRVISG